VQNRRNENEPTFVSGTPLSSLLARAPSIDKPNGLLASLFSHVERARNDVLVNDPVMHLHVISNLRAYLSVTSNRRVDLSLTFRF
jgi:hypothetical protein